MDKLTWLWEVALIFSRSWIVYGSYWIITVKSVMTLCIPKLLWKNVTFFHYNI